MKSEHANTYKVATCYTEKPLVRAVLAHYNDCQHTTSSAYVDGHTFTVYNYDDMDDYGIDQTMEGRRLHRCFSLIRMVSTWCNRFSFSKKQPVTDHSLIKSYHTMHGRIFST